MRPIPYLLTGIALWGIVLLLLAATATTIVRRRRQQTAHDQEASSGERDYLPDFAPSRRLVALVSDCVLAGILWYYPSRLTAPINVGVSKSGGSIVAVVGGPIQSQAVVQYFFALILYYILFESLFGASPGKMLLGLRVIDQVGDRPGFQRALKRNLFRAIDLIPGWYLVGFLVALFSRRRQRIGDHVADTYVVTARSIPCRTPVLGRRVVGAYACAGALTFVASYVAPTFAYTSADAAGHGAWSEINAFQCCNERSYWTSPLRIMGTSRVKSPR
jgi:uncharacterized RDD family membrane protein YckC